MECSVRTSDQPSTTNTTISTTTPGEKETTTSSVTTSDYDGEVITVKANGYKEANDDGTPKSDIIYFDWNTIAAYDLASPNATFYVKLENGLILKVPMRFGSKKIDKIATFV